MATFRLPHFSSAHVLQTIDRGRLLAFLNPYREFFRNRNVPLPQPGSGEPLPFEAIIRVLMSPDADTPHELIDALHYVDGMSTPEAMQALLQTARAAGLVLQDREEVTPADVAVQVWLLAPHLLERSHAEQYLTHPRTFEYFQSGEEDPPELTTVPPERVTAIERDLDDWFVDHRRGRTARVFVFSRPDGLWFLVRHGEPFKREESYQGTEPASVAYRPLKYDVIVYDACLRELRIHAQLKGEKDLYRASFGRHFFGDENFFPGVVKYTLEPLRERGESCLLCTDVDGLEWVKLKELHYRWGGVHSYFEIVRASDLFAAMSERRSPIPSYPTLAKAVFLVKFLGGRATAVGRGSTAQHRAVRSRPG